MATPGAFNGTNVFIRVNDGSDWLTIGGQLSHTETANTALLDITNKIGVPSFRELLPGQGMQSIDYTVEVVFNSDAAFRFVRDLAKNKDQALFQVVRGDIEVDGVVETQVTLQVQNLTQTSADNEPLTGSISLLSSDEFDYGLDVMFETYLTTDQGEYVTPTGGDYLVRI